MTWYERDDWERAWDPCRDLLGVDLLSGQSVAAVDSIEESTVRRYCESLEFDFPLFFDAPLARDYGYTSCLAPTSGVSQAWTHTGIWKTGQATGYPRPDRDAPIAMGPGPMLNQVDVGAPSTTATINAELSVEHFASACVGDRLYTSELILSSVVPKETSVGRGAFLTFTHCVRNQRQELVAVVERKSYRYRPACRRSKPKADVADTRVVSGDALITVSRCDWSTQLRFDEVRIGDALPTLSMNITLARLILHAGADRDIAQIHHNDRVARRYGAPSAFANNVFCQGVWERAVREYLGLGGKIHKVAGFRMRRFNPTGQRIVTMGRVVEKQILEGAHLLTLRLQTVNDFGVSIGPGDVTASLPE